MIVSILNLYNTRYLYITYIKDLEHLFRSVQELKANPSAQPHAGSAYMSEIFEAARRGEELKYDFAECKITSDVTEVLGRYSDSGHIFIDSKDPVRNAIFADNYQRYLNAQKPTMPLPEYDLGDKIVPYIAALDPNVIYTAKVGSDLDCYLILLATMVRPSLQFVLNSTNDKIIRIVSMLLDSNTRFKYSEFYYATDEGIQVLSAVDGQVHTQRYGLLPVRDAAAKGAMVPTAFGREVLYQQPGWKDVFERVLNIVNQMRASKPKSLLEVLAEEVTES